MASIATTQLIAVIDKEVRQTLRDRKMIAVLFLMPLIQLLILGKAVDFKVDDVPTVRVDMDGTAASRAHLDRLMADGTLRDVGNTDIAGMQAQLEDGSAAAAVVVPSGFGSDLDHGLPTTVQVILDGSNPTRSGVAGSAAGRFFAATSRARLEARFGRLPPGISLNPKVYYNPRLETAMYMVPGTAAMLLLMATTILAAMGLAREKELGTYEQVLVTPIPPWVLMFGKVLPFIVAGLVNVLAALVVGAWFFDVPIRGSLSFLTAATFAYLFSTLGCGLLISTLSDSQQQAFVGGFLFMMPVMLLSGLMTPISAMPGWMQPITLLNPMRYFVEILRADLLCGAGWADLWPQLVALLLFGAAILSVATLKFRKTLS